MRPYTGRHGPRCEAFPVAALGPLFSATSDALLLIDSAQILRAINPAAANLLGLSPTQACGRPWRQVFMLEREFARSWRHNPVVRCLHTARHQELDEDIHLVCGERRIALGGKVLALTGPRRLAMLCLQQPHSVPQTPSLNSRNEHELLLQHISRLNTVGELATGIAHEMNQPLSAIMSFNQAAMRLLGDDEPDVDRAAEALAEAVNQTRRAAAILERLRAFVGRQELELGPVAVNQVVINALTLLSSKLTEAGVRVSLRTEPCPPVRADALQLEQVMVNLVRNAAEAMQDVAPGSRLLQVNTHFLAERVHVSVIDSGPGLPPALQRQLFTRFFTTKTDGMGLGLSISRTIVEAAGGELSASNVPGAGACFRFSLPALITEESGHGQFAL